ncbi:DUF3375 domain-containing protein [Advenella sp. EE-W14]|uniref:DUF3375 domain-containing protein n=1 Tax=Advenella sp. EE-W14 TaxID=2722705 RepID=UPI00145C905C|nr:DUF3375 domain-containing protein [Advenella sp. EE-W14]
MDYQQLVSLRQLHPAWRLLRADNAPLIISFLQQAFVGPNQRSLEQANLASKLDDLIYNLQQSLGQTLFPRAANAYLDDWADNSNGWLRKFYPPGSDEAHYELTAAAEKTIEWLSSLGKRQFVGTESRLMSIFDLLRQVVEGSETDPDTRIAELEKRKAALDTEIARIKAGQIDLMDATRVRERFLAINDSADSLLADFREIEQNFRDLDRQVRERIATWEGGKGALLEEFFGERDAIADSDQGRSFRAFWEFLMSPSRQDELSGLLQKIFNMPPVQSLEPDRRLLRIHYEWLKAGEAAQRTVARLSEQLRRYLDDQAWLENKRIMNLLRDIEAKALSLRQQPPEKEIISLDDVRVEMNLPLDRPLYCPPLKPRIDTQLLLEGTSDNDADALFGQIHVDKSRLQENLRLALRQQPQISLGDLLHHYPLQQGLAELVTWLELATTHSRCVLDEHHTQLISWHNEQGVQRRASVPLIIFSH